MRYWYDTEFYEDGSRIHLISIGIEAEDGRSFYVENSSFFWADVPLTHWLWENVYPHLHWNVMAPHHKIGDMVRRFITKNGTEMNNELWGYYSSYDHVVLAQLFGKMVDMPDGVPWFTRDVKQELERLRMFDNTLQLPRQTSTEHHALADAQWTKQAWEFLRDTEYRSWGVM